MIKKILITGGDGVVASYAPKIFNNYQVHLFGKDKLDVVNIHNVRSIISDLHPDYIIHLAALTNVDYCQSHKEEAIRINYLGTANVAFIASEFNIPLGYISTAAVFDGKKHFYDEDDSPHPINVYAGSKLLGEQIIQELLKDFLIIRVGWIIGGKKKFISYIINDIKKHKTVKAVNDKFGSPIYAPDLLNFIKKKLEKKKYGLYHFGSRDICSRYDIACAVNKVLEILENKENKVKIIPVSSDEFVKDFPTPRPKYEGLKSKYEKFKKSWKAMVKEYVVGDLL